jgi:putative ABC transport system permease protein
MSGLLFRVRVFAGQLTLLAALGLVAALLVTGAPKVANHLADRALRNDIAAVPYAARDIILQQKPDVLGEADVARSARLLESYQQDLPQPLPGLVGESWFAGSVGPTAMTTLPPAGPKTLFGLRTQTGVTEAARLAAGRWPANVEPTTTDRLAPPAPVEIAVSTDVAKQMGLKLDTALEVRGALERARLAVRVVGIFDPVDRSAPVWDDAPQMVTPAPGLGDEFPPVAVALTDPVGLRMGAAGLVDLTYRWRYRIDERRLDAGMLDEVVAAVDEAQRTPFGPFLTLSTSLNSVLAGFAEQMRSVRALLAVVQAGLVSTLLGLVLLAARLAVERRRDEFALLRARGGAVLAIGGRTLGESAVVLPAAVLAGWGVGSLAPGRPPGTGWLLAVVGALTVLAVPVLAMAGQRRLSFSTRRRDLVGSRPSARRLTAELSVLGVAVLGVVLLRRRGLPADGGVDPYLVCVPVLLAAAAALLALRVVPWPLRQAGRVAARARGTVAFVGLARAGRGAPAIVGPLAVLVVAVTTGVFCSVVASTLDEARDRASVLAIPADAELTGFRFVPETADRLAALPGVTAVAPLVDYPGTSLTSGGRSEYARLLVVDPDTFRRVAERSGVDAGLPAVLAGAPRARGSTGTAPAVVSPQVAADFRDGGAATTRVGRFEFTVGAVADSFPGLGVGTGRFVVLPWQAVPQSPSGPLAPNRFLVAGDGFDVDALRRIGDDGQAGFAETSSGVPSQPTEVTTRAELRDRLERTGANQVLTYAFVVGTAGAAVLALLAIGFTVLADVRTRGQALSRLRTMGLSGRQSRTLLVYELVPLVCAAVLAGALVGVLLPRLLGETLGLDIFTAGMAATIHFDPVLVAGLLALVVAALAVAVSFENMVNRRLRLGEVLRLGEEG